jgi:hypothetical protein
MRRAVSIILLVFCCACIYAQQVKIIKCNTPTVNVGGKDLSVGNSFDKNSTIKWSSKTQVVMVRNSDGRVIRLAASLSEDGSQDIVSKLLQKQYAHLSSRGDEFPGGTYYVEDSLSIPIDLEEGIRPELELIYTINGQAKTFKPILSKDGKAAVISNAIFQNVDEHKIECKLIGKIDGDVIELSDPMILIPIEYSIDE